MHFQFPSVASFSNNVAPRLLPINLHAPRQAAARERAKHGRKHFPSAMQK
jgi:hypothetical protein